MRLAFESEETRLESIICIIKTSDSLRMPRGEVHSNSKETQRHAHHWSLKLACLKLVRFGRDTPDC